MDDNIKRLTPEESAAYAAELRARRANPIAGDPLFAPVYRWLPDALPCAAADFDGDLRVSRFPVRSMGDAELFALALGLEEDAARELLAENGGAYGLARAVESGALGYELPAEGARRFEAVAEALRRAAAVPITSPIRSSRDVVKAYGPRFVGAMTESFLVVALDAKRRPVADAVIADGDVSGCSVPLRSVVLFAAKTGASAVILLHNHPSGDPAPSAEDIAFTRRACAVMEGIAEVVDHVIVGRDGSFSFLDSGMIVAGR